VVKARPALGNVLGSGLWRSRTARAWRRGSEGHRPCGDRTPSGRCRQRCPPRRADPARTDASSSVQWRSNSSASRLGSRTRLRRSQRPSVGRPGGSARPSAACGVAVGRACEVMDLTAPYSCAATKKFAHGALSRRASSRRRHGTAGVAVSDGAPQPAGVEVRYRPAANLLSNLLYTKQLKESDD